VRTAAAALILDKDSLRDIQAQSAHRVDPFKRMAILEYQVAGRSYPSLTKTYFRLDDKPLEDSSTSTDNLVTRRTVAWASQTGIGLLYCGDGPDKKRVACIDDILCLAYAGKICGPDHGWYSFTIYGREHRFWSWDDQLSKQWAAILGNAIAEAQSVRSFIEESPGYQKSLRSLELLKKDATTMDRAEQSLPAIPFESKGDRSFITLQSNEDKLQKGQLEAEFEKLRLSHSNCVSSPAKRPKSSHTPASLDHEGPLNAPRDFPDERRKCSALLPQYNPPNNSGSDALLPTSSITVPRTLDREQSLSMRLDVYFAEGRDDQDTYTEAEIQNIADMLKHQNPRWSRVPRTYVVLPNIGHLDLLDGCIDVGFSDYWFPVTERTLPDILRPSVRSAFVEAQSLVLTESIGLEKGEKHCHFKKGEMLPFEMKGVLGSGGYGQVDRVLSLISFREYARKRVPRSAFGGRKKEDFKQFIAEIEILKRLQHRHVVELVGSYTDPRYIGLIMSPIADQDLSAYLAQASSTLINRPELRTFFGCLATALEYLHSNNVRHKDIKPSNVLVSNGKVLLADFGLSFDFTDAPSTTMSMVNGMTPRYCAPEVAAEGPRNTMSDIWCLGVVFLEMIVVLKGETLQDMDAFLRQHGGSEQPFIRLNIAALPELIAHLEETGQWIDNKALEWTGAMLSVVQTSRPTAAAFVTQIVSPVREEQSAGFCGICCMMAEEEEFSDSTSY
jgi:hypothetical protein